MLRLDINLVFTIINLLVWYAVIRIFLFNRVNKVIDQREQAIQSRYADARKLQEEAAAEKDRYAVSQAQIEEEKTRVLDQAREDARTEYSHILEDAQKKAEQIVEHSRKEAVMEKEKIVSKAEKEIRSIILDSAVKSMQASGNESTLYDEFLAKAGETGHGENE